MNVRKLHLFMKKWCHRFILAVGFLCLTNCAPATLMNELGTLTGNTTSSSSGGSSNTTSSNQGQFLTGDELMDSEEIAFLTLINEYRVQNGLVPLQLSVTLTQAASWMANDMAFHNYLSHTDSTGRDAWSRITAYGYPSSNWGENCAAGNSTAALTFQQWKNSPGHNANMLGANFRVIGIARAYNASSTYKNYWTTDFGGTVDGTFIP